MKTKLKKTHKTIWVGRDLKTQLVPAPGTGWDTSHQPRLVRAIPAGLGHLGWAPCAREQAQNSASPLQTNTKYQFLLQAAYLASCSFHHPVVMKVSLWLWPMERQFFLSPTAISQLSEQRFAEKPKSPLPSH